MVKLLRKRWLWSVPRGFRRRLNSVVAIPFQAQAQVVGYGGHDEQRSGSHPLCDAVVDHNPQPESPQRTVTILLNPKP